LIENLLSSHLANFFSRFNQDMVIALDTVVDTVADTVVDTVAADIVVVSDTLEFFFSKKTCSDIF
jgi:hypothetical protein